MQCPELTELHLGDWVRPFLFITVIISIPIPLELIQLFIVSIFFNFSSQEVNLDLSRWMAELDVISFPPLFQFHSS